MTLTNQEITDIAKLARLELTQEETTKYAEQLSAIFDYVRMLEEVDTSAVEETCQVTGLTNVMRDDEVQKIDSEHKKKLLEAFPDKIGSLLKVKKVFE